MKLLKIIAATSAMAMLIGCGGTKPLISFEYASATEYKIDSKNSKDMGVVKSTCISAGENGMGLMETAVANALAQTPGATYIKEAKFSTGANCVEVTGTAMGPM
jgi:hypothetical protein